MARWLLVVLLPACSFQIGSAPADAPPGGGDATDALDATAIDGPPADASMCFGTGVVQVCLEAFPSGPRTFLTPTAIDTGDDLSCDPTTNAEAVGLCVVAGAGIQIDARLRAVGNRPLVLVSTLGIVVTGEIDVASHGNMLGAGAEPTDACVAGTPATAGGSSGGGYGGSFGGKGADGETNDGGSGGVASAATPNPTVLRGGCAGGTSRLSNSTAPAGRGGGAVALIAAGTISIDGPINASGSGGRQGAYQDQGAGGGGSGGMIVLDAPTITATVSVFANGGGGGEGNGVAGGNPGGEPMSATAAAAGGAGGTSSGGNGGDGSLGGDGGDPPGNAASNGGGGGGGGGGAGVIKASTAISGGTVSPSPS